MQGNDPDLNGFAAGTYLDGSTIYAGSGSFPSCYNAVKIGARIQTSKSNFAPGAYLPCDLSPTGEFFDNSTNAQYFYNHPNLQWVPTTADKARFVPGVFPVGPSWYLARILQTSANGTYTQVGFVDIGQIIMLYRIPTNPATSARQSKGGAISIDVLACPPLCTNGGKGELIYKINY